MKIVEIEGTPQEIADYKARKNTPVYRSTPVYNSIRKNMLANGKHWSNSKSQWVSIADMNSTYIMNILRIKFRDNSNDTLLDNDEFQSLIYNLADKLLEE